MQLIQEPQPKTHYLAVYRVYHPEFPKLALYGGEYPGAALPQTHHQKVQELTALGITSSLCLMQSSEFNYFLPYVSKVDKLKQDFNFFNYPIVDMGIPDNALMKTILDKIDALIAKEEHIYVHCAGGHGRTGTVIGCWLKRHFFQNEEIYQKLMDWRKQTLFGDEPSPQTRHQLMMIKQWPLGE